jgi:hypothetical protein
VTQDASTNADSATPRHEPLVLDQFSADVPRGRVDGTPASGGRAPAVRHITDAEGMISIDHGALRIPTLATPGFGRSALSYGPFVAEPGLTLAVWMLNGHNTSQTLATYSVLKQAYRFFRGGNAFSMPQQVSGWCRHPARESLLRRLQCWVGARRAKDAGIKDNLMVGFFAEAARPAQGGASGAFVMHAASHECGDLRVTSTGSSATYQPQHNQGTSVVHGFQNVEALYVVALRQGSVLYYLAATPGARGSSTAGTMRPVAIERRPEPSTAEKPKVYAGVQQAVLGEIAFSVDSRVHGVIVDRFPHLAPRFGGAHVANANAASIRPDIGESWIIHADCRWVAPHAATGLISTWITPTATPAGLIFRVQDAANRWQLLASRNADGTHIELQCITAGQATKVAAVTLADLEGDFQLLILDDGRSVGVRAAGQVIGLHSIHDDTHATARGVGIVGSTVRDFEAHPREVPIPAQMRVRDFWSPKAGRVVLQDTFQGGTGELDGRAAPTVASIGIAPHAPPSVWTRSFGSGRFDLVQDGAKVRGSPGNPCPMRTLYTLPWTNHTFADIEASLTPPGSGRFERQNGRSGVVLWQDARNHLIVNLWLHDGYEGASISSFLVVDGFDDVYNAVWTNIGSRVRWNKAFRLGVAFDGDGYLVRVDDEPVLFRRVTDVYPRSRPFNITRVGLASNWEWGLDTGTVFHSFVARDNAAT